jgi:hypothetical protein
LPIDRDLVAGLPLVVLDERRGLDEHAAGAAVSVFRDVFRDVASFVSLPLQRILDYPTRWRANPERMRFKSAHN